MGLGVDSVVISASIGQTGFHVINHYKIRLFRRSGNKYGDEMKTGGGVAV